MTDFISVQAHHIIQALILEEINTYNLMLDKIIKMF